MTTRLQITSPRKPVRATETECTIRVRAELISLGGALLLGICMVLTAVLFMALVSPNVTAIQRGIAVVLVVGAWVYFFNSCTEELSLTDHTFEFRAKLSRSLTIPLDELESMTLTHEGFNLERGIETLEFRRAGKKPDRISLGPCWQRHKLEDFLESMRKALQ